MSAKNSIRSLEKRVLLVEGNQESTENIADVFQHELYKVHIASSTDNLFEVVAKWNPHVVLMNTNLTGLQLAEVLAQIRKHRFYVSVILISSETSTEGVISGLDAGADDYVCLPFNKNELLARVRTQIRIKELNDKLRIANEKLKELVETDDLTGLLNMRSIYQRLDHELDRCRRFKRCVCVVMMDMDYFKSVNDGHDHLFGSFVLSEVGQIIKNCVRSVDIAARYGGDEFMMVLTEVTAEGAMFFCERLKKAIEEKVFESGEDSIRLTTSLGFAVTAPGEANMDSRRLVRIADHALYEAKESGRNCIRYFNLTDTPNPLGASSRKKAPPQTG